MQTVSALEVQLADARTLIVEDEKRLGELRAAKALDVMSDDEAAELRTVRQRIRDRADEVSDLEVALKVAEEFEKSAAGQKRRADAIATVLRVEAVGLAMIQAATAEDAAGAAHEAAMGRRSALQVALQAQARQALELMRGPITDQHSSDQMSHLVAAAEAGIPQAVAYRVARLAGGTKGMIALGPGVHFDAQARLTVAGAASASLNGLLLRLSGLLQAAGIAVPEQGLQSTREHAASIVAAMNRAAAKEAA